MVVANEVNYKIGPLLHKKISPPQTEQKTMLFKQYDSSGPSVEGDPEDFIKIIVVMDRDHLSDLTQSIIDELETKVTELGGYLGGHAFNRVQVFIPVGKITELAEWEEIRQLKLPTPAGATGGAVRSEGISIGNVNNWHINGFTGKNVRVGVLDGGFYGYANLIGSDLPQNTKSVYTGSISDFNSSEHGTACAEIIHDVAPDAELYLVNAADMDVDYTSAVNWLKQQDVDIISSSYGLNLLYTCKVIYELLNSSLFNVNYWSFQAEEISRLEEQINHTVSYAVNSGVTWSQAANNNARQRWTGVFKDTDYDHIHNFTNGSNYNEVILPSDFEYGKDVYAVMIWGNDTDHITYDDYDLKIVNEYGHIVASSLRNQLEMPLGMEACKITPIPGRKYYIKIERYQAAIQEIMILIGIDAFASLAEYSPEKTVLLGTPCANPDVITVGAVPYYNPYVIEDFSGQGPSNNGAIKPDLVAPDAVSTVSYGSPFYGTSAAAPHVAGVSALVKQKYPSFSPQQIKSYLGTNAIDLGATGKDNVYGSGLVQLPYINNCTFDISPATGSFTSDGGESTVFVDASNSSCSWTASENLSWVNLSPISGTGSQSVVVSVKINTDAARNGSITIAGKTYIINQSGTNRVKDFVSRFYHVVLGRKAEEAGLNYWTSSLEAGTLSGADVAREFIFSNEFKNKNLGNEAYVDVLYAAFFNRMPDPGGKNFWLGGLYGGTSREDVLNGFIYSQEFVNLCHQYSIKPFN
jgi:subtilisin family serine protease